MASVFAVLIFKKKVFYGCFRDTKKALRIFSGRLLFLSLFN